MHRLPRSGADWDTPRSHTGGRTNWKGYILRKTGVSGLHTGILVIQKQTSDRWTASWTSSWLERDLICHHLTLSTERYCTLGARSRLVLSYQKYWLFLLYTSHFPHLRLTPLKSIFRWGDQLIQFDLDFRISHWAGKDLMCNGDGIEHWLSVDLRAANAKRVPARSLLDAMDAAIFHDHFLVLYPTHTSSV
jgi:hypothetical protein